MRKRLYDELICHHRQGIVGICYDAIIIACIIASWLTLIIKNTAFVTYVNYITLVVFIIDYILRWSTYDIKTQSSKATVFIKYPFTVMALIDLLSMMPYFELLHKSFKFLKFIKVLKLLRIIRLFEAIHMGYESLDLTHNTDLHFEFHLHHHDKEHAHKK